MNELAAFSVFADNKAYLAHLLSEELCLQAPEDTEIVVAGKFRYELEVKSSICITDLGPMKCTHEEADTRLVLHAVHSQFHTVAMPSKGSDVLLLLVSHFQSTRCQYLLMKSGTSKKRRCIPIDAVFNKLPGSSAATLLAFHALTGCDTTSHNANHTKRSSWKIFKEHHGLLKNLGIGEPTEGQFCEKLNQQAYISKPSYFNINGFVCTLIFDILKQNKQHDTSVIWFGSERALIETSMSSSSPVT